MEQAQSHEFDLQAECIRLCVDLRSCLQRERIILIEFKVEEIPLVTLQKESLMLALVRKRGELKSYLKHRYGIEKIVLYADQLEGEPRILWLERESNWRTEWAQLRDTVRCNQDFLKHSLKNLFALSDNLKRCLGEPSLYSAKGARVELQTEGKVVAASY